MGRMVTICDAVTADLEGTLSLPPHKTIKYAHPPLMVPERCPALGVYYVTFPRIIIATPGTYYLDDEVHVAWFESAAAYGETAGATDNDLPRRMLNTIELIGDRLEVYAISIPGLPAVGSVDVPAYGTIGTGESGANPSGMVWRAHYVLTISGTALRAIP